MQIFVHLFNQSDFENFENKKILQNLGFEAKYGQTCFLGNWQNQTKKEEIKNSNLENNNSNNSNSFGTLFVGMELKKVKTFDPFYKVDFFHLGSKIAESLATMKVDEIEIHHISEFSNFSKNSDKIDSQKAKKLSKNLLDLQLGIKQKLWKFDKYKTNLQTEKLETQEKKAPIKILLTTNLQKHFDEFDALKLESLDKGMSLNRFVVEETPENFNPKTAVEIAQNELGNYENVEIKVRDYDWLLENGFGAVCAVGRASENKPNLVHVKLTLGQCLESQKEKMTSWKVFILHCRGGKSDENFYRSVGGKSAKAGLKVEYLNVPNSIKIDSQNWLEALNKVKSQIDEQTIFITHSLGSLALARFLTDNDIKIGNWHSVAGVFGFGHTIGREDIEKHFATFDPISLDWQKINDNINQIFIHHTIADPTINFQAAKNYCQKLPKAELVVEDDKYGHFGGKNQFEFPELVNKVLHNLPEDNSRNTDKVITFGTPNLEIKSPRENVRAVLFDPQTQKYCLVQMENLPFFLPGGGTDGESLKTALAREIEEELGYTNFEIKAKLGKEILSYAENGKHKFCSETGFLVVLNSPNQKEIQLSQNEKQKNLAKTWLGSDEVLEIWQTGKAQNPQLEPLWEIFQRGVSKAIQVGLDKTSSPKVFNKEFITRIVLIGKGLTYDTGGLDIKTDGHMKEMKTDMGGSGLMLGVMKTLAEMTKSNQCKLQFQENWQKKLTNKLEKIGVDLATEHKIEFNLRPKLENLENSQLTKKENEKEKLENNSSNSDSNLILKAVLNNLRQSTTNPKIIQNITNLDQSNQITTFGKPNGTELDKPRVNVRGVIFDPNENQFCFVVMDNLPFLAGGGVDFDEKNNQNQGEKEKNNSKITNEQKEASENDKLFEKENSTEKQIQQQTFEIKNQTVKYEEFLKTNLAREIQEELGYFDFEIADKLGSEIISYLPSDKATHRFTSDTGFLVILKSKDKKEIQLSTEENEKKLREVWYKSEEIIQIWDRNLGGENPDLGYARHREIFRRGLEKLPKTGQQNGQKKGQEASEGTNLQVEARAQITSKDEENSVQNNLKNEQKVIIFGQKPPQIDNSRESVRVILFDPKSGKYAVCWSKKTDFYSTLGGGIENGENLLEAAKRELIEESGFVDFEIVENLGKVNCYFIENNQNFERISTGFLAILKSNKNIGQNLTEQEKIEGHHCVWGNKDEIIKKFQGQIGYDFSTTLHLEMFLGGIKKVRETKLDNIILIETINCLINTQKSENPEKLQNNPNNLNNENKTDNLQLNKELWDFLQTLLQRKILVTNATGEKLKQIKKLFEQKNLEENSQKENPENQEAQIEIFSLEFKSPKTNPEHFQSLLTKLDLDKDKCLYFDHNLDNLNSAKSVGIQGELFEKNKQIIDFLKTNLNLNLENSKKIEQKMEIRKAKPTDLEKMFEIKNGVIQVNTSNILGTTKNDVLEQDWQGRFDRFRNNFEKENYQFWVLEISNTNSKEIIGFSQVIYEQDCIELDKLYLQKEYQKMGFGTKLLNYTLNNLRNFDQDLRVEVVAFNDFAIQFYQKFGFIPTENKLEPFIQPSGHKIPAIEMILTKENLTKLVEKIKSEQVLDKLLQKIQELQKLNPDKPFIIAIDGRGRSGKSTLAKKISQNFKTQIIKTDDFITFFKPEISEKDYYWDKNRFLQDVILPLKNKQNFKYNICRWKTGEIVRNEEINQNNELIIVEGLHALHQDLLEFYDLKIWVNTPLEISLEMGKARDLQKGKQNIDELWDIFVPVQENYISEQKPQEQADFIISTKNSEYEIMENFGEEKQAVLDLVKLILEKSQSSKKPFVIGIDGRSGSGKSTLSSKLEKLLLNSQRFNLDAFDLNGGDFFSPTNIAKKFEIDFENRQFDENKIQKEIAEKDLEFVILEGTFGFKNLQNVDSDLKIWVELKKEIAEKRLNNREINERTEIDPEIIKLSTQKWQEAEDRYLQNFKPKKNADVVISTENGKYEIVEKAENINNPQIKQDWDISTLQIETERLILKPISLDFAEEIFREFTPEVTKYMYPKPNENLEETKEFIQKARQTDIEKTELHLVIQNKNSEFLGMIGLHQLNTKSPEFGIWLKKSTHGNKFGQEAANGLKTWADKHLNYKNLIYPADQRNIGSRKVAEFLGGILQNKPIENKINASGNNLEIVEYHIPKPNYHNSQSLANTTGTAPNFGSLEIHWLTAFCENSVSFNSYRSDDILTSFSGQTVEIWNTDAEGRLTLADVLSYSTLLEPDFIVDAATLTGACVVANSCYFTGLMGNDEILNQNLLTSFIDNNEYTVQNHFPEILRSSVCGTLGDLVNTGKLQRQAGHVTAGLFLSHFIDQNNWRPQILEKYNIKYPKTYNWVHLDIAGTSFNKAQNALETDGATGQSVRSLVDWILSLE